MTILTIIHNFHILITKFWHVWTVPKANIGVCSSGRKFYSITFTVLLFFFCDFGFTILFSNDDIMLCVTIIYIQPVSSIDRVDVSRIQAFAVVTSCAALQLERQSSGHLIDGSFFVLSNLCMPFTAWNFWYSSITYCASRSYLKFGIV